MKKIKIITLCMLLFSCNSNQVELGHTFQVDTSSKSTISMSDFVDDVSYLTLESTPQSLLSNIRALYVDDDYLIIPSGSSVYFFDAKGKYLNKIDKQGRGNGEYISMSDITIDCENNRVLIYDLSSKLLLYYSYDGKHLGSIDNFSESRYLRDVVLLPDGNFLCSEYMHGGADFEQTAELWEVDPSGRVVSDIIKSEFKHPVQSPSFVLSQYSNGKFIYSDVENDVDYLYQDGAIEVIARYDLQGRPVAKTYADMDNMGFANDYWMAGKFFNSRVYAVVKNNYIFTRWHGEKQDQTYYTLVNLSDDTIVTGCNLDCTLPNGQIVYPSAVGKTGPYYAAIENNIDGVISMVMDPSSIDDPAILSRFGLDDDSQMNSNVIVQLLHV